MTKEKTYVAIVMAPPTSVAAPPGYYMMFMGFLAQENGLDFLEYLSMMIGFESFSKSLYVFLVGV